MYPLKLKVSLFIALLTALLLTVYLTGAGFSEFSSNPSYLKSIIPFIQILYAAAIVLSPMLFGIMGAGIILFTAFLVIPILSAITLSYAYNIGLIILSGIAFVVYIFFSNIMGRVEKRTVSAQEIKEAANLLKADWHKAEAANSALSQRLSRYRNLRHIGESFSAKISLENIYQLTVQTAYDMIPGSDAALLFIADESRQELMLAASKRSSPQPHIKSKAGDIFDTWVFKERQTLSVEDVSEDFRFDYKPLPSERHFKSLISVPMVSQSRMIGLLRLNSLQKNAYSFDDLRLLDFISDLSSSAINNARLYETTEELSTRDSLTGLYIHRHMKILLHEQMERARLNKLPLSVVMIDIDHFKDYNDKYGHSAGDKVLLGISRILKSAEKKHAQLTARYGGEEFLLILPNVNNKGAFALAEQLRQEVSRQRFVLRREETVVTISAGVASYSQDMRDKDDLLKRSDFLLYKAKKEGRNKVCAA
jgi:diguanylate cyclase (GGDEF)-like protein